MQSPAWARRYCAKSHLGRRARQSGQKVLLDHVLPAHSRGDAKSALGPSGKDVFVVDEALEDKSGQALGLIGFDPVAPLDRHIKQRCDVGLLAVDVEEVPLDDGCVIALGGPRATSKAHASAHV